MLKMSVVCMCGAGKGLWPTALSRFIPSHYAHALCYYKQVAGLLEHGRVMEAILPVNVLAS